jgi:D-beta-D-heptose 7-phosphate kinase/D-beta-D-heptose 1-phosphate adenosyltransferase
VLAHGQQVARVDQETASPLSDEDAERLFSRIKAVLPKADAIIVSDYAKGIFVKAVVRKLIDLANAAGKPVLVDPKGKDYSKYSGSTLLTPNRHEAADAAGLDHSTPNVVEESGERLMERLELDALLITRGEEGMTLFSRNGGMVHHKAHALEVYDVTGAGDTVIATLGVALAAGAHLVDAARIANIAAGLVVGQIGTTAVKLDELRREFARTDLSE